MRVENRTSRSKPARKCKYRPYDPGNNRRATFLGHAHMAQIRLHQRIEYCNLQLSSPHFCAAQRSGEPGQPRLEVINGYRCRPRFISCRARRSRVSRASFLALSAVRSADRLHRRQQRCPANAFSRTEYPRSHLTLADGKRLNVGRLDDRWISAVSDDVSYKLDRQNGNLTYAGSTMKDGIATTIIGAGRCIVAAAPAR